MFVGNPGTSYISELSMGAQFFTVSVSGWQYSKDDLPETGECVFIVYNGISRDEFYQINFWDKYPTEYLLCNLKTGAGAVKKEDYSVVEKYLKGEQYEKLLEYFRRSSVECKDKSLLEYFKRSHVTDKSILEYLKRSSQKTMDYPAIDWSDMSTANRALDWLIDNGYREVDYIPELIGVKFTHHYMPKGEKVFARYHFSKKGGLGQASANIPGWTNSKNNYNCLTIYNGTPLSIVCLGLTYYPKNLFSDERLDNYLIFMHMGIRSSIVKSDSMTKDEKTNLLNYLIGLDMTSPF